MYQAETISSAFFQGKKLCTIWNGHTRYVKHYATFGLCTIKRGEWPGAFLRVCVCRERGLTWEKGATTNNVMTIKFRFLSETDTLWGFLSLVDWVVSTSHCCRCCFLVAQLRFMPKLSKFDKKKNCPLILSLSLLAWIKSDFFLFEAIVLKSSFFERELRIGKRMFQFFRAFFGTKI